MNLNIKKIFSILFKKSSLFNLLIFSLLNILSTSAFFAPIAYNVIIGTIFYVITISLLIGYITETTHLFILNNFEEIELPKWNLNILKYLKHSFSLVLIFIIFELIFYFISLIPFKFLSDILQLLYIFILTFIVPCSVIIYAKNLKIIEALHYNNYFQLIKNNFKKFILIYVFITVFFIIFLLFNKIIGVMFVGSSIYSIYFYLLNYMVFINYFLISLFYAQLFQKEER